ncbi:uncharacterized protein TRIVIDRAFT_219615 [Trichoderma virens Gv29-8]|uniref:DUF7709 domain-containing protein n=1 Tax=Hypocrea virens (strain Gv29-8 / FGSC 10586) TaxID=413071 RepID=G9MK49_HYPVG|nr:uncharacterized protein TRIVIDRAFT_219615 [Trichoderma virens Gv29-8]EHK25854.1 hypothetical protein TRIVIDRAFT_219615 [Trichoderma virens Gv29-8]UKZ48322.1 hypothetical protein TrVGV298_002545 [Trichoderma virens]UKZ74859.1 hypothetical protein TrVFT333_002529 [Trichoderma virens FT-333]
MDANNRTADDLQKINNKTLGTNENAFPVVTLPNGHKVPTGTVGALLVNIKTYDESNDDQRKAIEPALRATIPVLQQVGMFDLFKPQEWIQGGSPGRALVGKLAMEHGGSE